MRLHPPPELLLQPLDHVGGAQRPVLKGQYIQLRALSEINGIPGLRSPGLTYWGSKWQPETGAESRFLRLPFPIFILVGIDPE